MEKCGTTKEMKFRVVAGVVERSDRRPDTGDTRLIMTEQAELATNLLVKTFEKVCETIQGRVVIKLEDARVHMEIHPQAGVSLQDSTVQGIGESVAIWMKLLQTEDSLEDMLIEIDFQENAPHAVTTITRTGGNLLDELLPFLNGA